MLRYKNSLHRKELKERVICMNDSKEFQDTASICSRKLSHVPSQLAMIPSSRSMLSRYKRLPLDTWNTSGLQEHISGNPRALFDSSQILHQTILHATNQSATGGIPVQRSTGRPVAKGEEQTGNAVPISIFERRPSTMNSFSPAMVDQQRLHISELHFDKFPTPSTFSCWKTRFKTQVCSFSNFPSEAGSWTKEVEMVDSVDSKPSRSTEFANFEMLDAKIASSLNNILNSHFQEEGQSRDAESPKGGSILTRKTSRLHDLRLLSSHWLS